MDNSAETAYAGWPERLYVIGADGTVAYVGRLGPDGYLPVEVQAWLKDNVADAPPAATAAGAAGAADAAGAAGSGGEAAART